MKRPKYISCKKPNGDDRAIGERIRGERIFKGITQKQLGEAVGVSHQLIAKYEAGAARIPAARLGQIAVAMGEDISILFPLNLGGRE